MIRVPGHGSTSARIVIVGEAPGGDEEIAGQPFVGAAGNLLTQMLQAAGIPRQECYITNVSKFRPPSNDIDQFVQYGKKRPDGTWVPCRGAWVKPHVAEHVTELEQELQLIKPNVIIALGNTPLYFLTGKLGITKWRGSMMNTHWGKLVPAIHPASTLRDYTSRPDTISDLGRALKASLYEEPFTLPEWVFHIRPSFKQATDYLRSLLARASSECFRLICDIETRKRQIACLGFATSKMEAMCIPLMCVERPEGYWTPAEELEMVQLLCQVLTHPNIQMANQNYLFDAFFMGVWWGIKSIAQFDTMIAENVCFPGKEKALSYLASHHCDYYEFWKDDGRDWDPRQPEDQLWRYNCMDCVYTYEIVESFEHTIPARGLTEQFQRQMRMFEPTLEAMLDGIRTLESDKVEVSVALQQAIDDRQAWLEKTLQQPINIRSHPQLTKLFYEDFQGPRFLHRIHKNRDTGRPTCNDKALEEIKEEEPLLRPVIERIQEMRTLGIFKSTFVDTDGPKNRFYYSLNPAGTKTFRYSGSANPFGWGTNPQNIPKREDDESKMSDFEKSLPDIRGLFVPDGPEYCFIDMDLSKADLHVVAWEADEQELKDMLAAGVNIYKANAGVVQMPYVKAKSFIHGTDYGGGFRTMARNCKIPEAKSKWAQEQWFRKYPGIKRWHERVERILYSTNEITNAFGYKIFFFDRLNGLLPEALAWGPQSTVAIVINTIWHRIRYSGLPIRVKLQVHDSLLMQVLIRDVNWLCPKILDLAKVVVPYPKPLIIPADIKVSNVSWGQVKKWTPDWKAA